MRLIASCEDYTAAVAVWDSFIGPLPFQAVVVNSFLADSEPTLPGLTRSKGLGNASEDIGGNVVTSCFDILLFAIFYLTDQFSACRIDVIPET